MYGPDETTKKKREIDSARSKNQEKELIKMRGRNIGGVRKCSQETHQEEKKTAYPKEKKKRRIELERKLNEKKKKQRRLCRERARKMKDGKYNIIKGTSNKKRRASGLGKGKRAYQGCKGGILK